MRILLLPGTYTSPSSRFRIWQFVEPIKALGHEVEVRVTSPDRQWSGPGPGQFLRASRRRWGQLRRAISAARIAREASGFDVVLMNRDLVPEPRETLLERLLLRSNPHTVFDFDDAIHIGRREAKLRKLLPLFSWVTPGNDFLAEFARELTDRVSVWPTVVNTDLYRPVPERLPGPLRIGWSGSRSTSAYCLPLLEGVIRKLAEIHTFEFVTIADVDPCLRWSGVTTRHIQWTAETEVAGLQHLDIGLMPLRDEPFERGKCGLKAIQYMGVGIPSLVSPVGVNKEIVVHSETGFHCATDAGWIANLGALMQNPALRVRQGLAGRERADRLYSVRSLLPRIVSTLEAVSMRRQPTAAPLGS